MRKIALNIVFFLLLFPLAIFGQDASFSQYYSTGLYLNPALAAMEKDIYFGTNYRSQWKAADIPFNTLQVTYIHPLIGRGVRGKHLGGFGASFFKDETGANSEFKTTGFNLAGAYNFHLNHIGNNTIAIALQAGVFQKRINFDRLQWSSQYDPSVGFDNTLPANVDLINEQVTFPKINIGVLWSMNDKKHYLDHEFSTFHGLSVANINNPNESFLNEEEGRLPLLYKLHGGFNIYLNRKFDVSPNYLIFYQNNTVQTNVGSYISYPITNLPHAGLSDARVTLGLWYRLHDSFIFSSGIQSKLFNVAFSYDMNTSSLGSYTSGVGAFEISMAVKLIRQRHMKRFSTPLI